MRVREPVARPLDIVLVELLLSGSQAFLVGVMAYLATGLWQDLGVTLGSAAAVLVLIAIALAGAWFYWLLGGVGWPMAAANAVAGLFLGAMLLLTWFGEAFRLGGAPLGLAVAAAVYGVGAGVFLDSPRRWRWDQREKLRPGTRVPRVSAATRALVAQVPRSLPRRPVATEPVSELAARIEASSAPGPEHDPGVLSVPAAAERPDEASWPAADEPGTVSDLTDAPGVAGRPLEVPEAPEPVMPTVRPRGPSPGPADTAHDEGIELPTMLEPRAQRSPWAWAAPPAWNRDEDDEPGPDRSPKDR